MPAFKNITGERFGRLVVMGLHSHSRSAKPRHNTLWLCHCDCGEDIVTDLTNLRKGDTQSCGCFWRERNRSPKTHGQTVGGRPSGAYVSWALMVQRCTNPNNNWYKHYGGRGIQVCDRWRSFENFWEDMGDRPDGYSIERIDNDGNYEPQNCKWIPMSEQQKNQRKPKPYVRKARPPGSPPRSRKSPGPPDG